MANEIRVELESAVGHAEHFAVVGTDGTRPVVWGLGSTVEEARADAAAQDGYDDDDSNVVAVSAEVAGRIQAGEVACDVLGIKVGG